MTTSDSRAVKQRWQSAIDAFRSGDAAAALYLFKDLAKDGELGALREIGNIYELGDGGVEQDFKKAFYWYKRAVDEADDVWGYIGLGRLYYYGRGVVQDYEKAFWYYSMAEANNKPIVSLMLGRMYHLGHGVESDLRKARKYYLEAANEEYVFAIKNLGLLEMKSGHYLKGLYLRIRAILTALRILVKVGTRDKRLGSA